MTIAARNNLYLRKLLFSSSVFDGIISWHQGRQAFNIEQIGFTSHCTKPHTYIEFYSWTASCSADPGTTCRQCQCNPRPAELTSHILIPPLGDWSSPPSSHSSPSRSSLWSQVLGYVPRLQYNSDGQTCYIVFQTFTEFVKDIYKFGVVIWRLRLQYPFFGYHSFDCIGLKNIDCHEVCV